MDYTNISPSKLKANIFEALSKKCIVAIDERKLVIKVNAKGQRRKKVLCGPGKKWDGTKCVVQSASEKLTQKKSHRLASKTKKAQGAGALRRRTKLTNKAMKKRKGQGL